MAIAQRFGMVALLACALFHVEQKETDTCPYLFHPLPHLRFAGVITGEARILNHWQSTPVRRFEKIVIDMKKCLLIVGLVSVL
jgi:hypothetical protein